MQLAFFSVPARGDAGAQDDLNSFLRSHRVMTVHREFVGQGENAFWALAVEYMEGAPGTPRDGASFAPPRGGKDRVDYKEVLSPTDFALFAKLRDWRKRTSETEGIPVYAVLTNEQLASIAAKRPGSLAEVKAIEGVGEAKAGKYGEGVLAVVADNGGSGDVSNTNDNPAKDGMESVPANAGKS